VTKGLAAFVAVCIILAGSGYLYFQWQWSKVARVAIDDLVGDSGGLMNVLLVGSDSRDRLEGDMADQAGKNQVSGRRSDTIMILHMDSKNKKAAILSIPRDLWVKMAPSAQSGSGQSNRINAAYSVGGPKGLVDTIQSSLGIPINHYVEVDFVGFKDIVDAVGGVNVFVPAPARDKFSGLRIGEPGCIKLDGVAGLAWVRSRHYESFESGKWREDPTSDLGRIQRQQDFIRRMLRKALSSGLTNPIRLNRLIGIGVHDVTLDTQMSTPDVMKLAKRFRSLDPETVDMLTVPTTGTNIGGASVLLIKKDEAQPYIDRLNGRVPPVADGAPAARPADVRVRVLNGTGADGIASQAGALMETAGFNVADKGDADSFSYTKSQIRYAPGQLAKAQLLQRYLQAGATIKEDKTLRTVDVAVVLGSDYTGVRAQPGPAAGAPPTTVAHPSSTPAPKGAPAQASC